MKKIKIHIIILCTLLATGSMNNFAIAKCLPTIILPPASDDTCIESSAKHIKNINDALLYIYKYVSHKDYGNLSREEGGWVEIPLSQLKEYDKDVMSLESDTPHCGIMCYYVYNNGKFHLAHKYDKIKYVKTPIPNSGTYRVSTHDSSFYNTNIKCPYDLLKIIVNYEHVIKDTSIYMEYDKIEKPWIEFSRKFNVLDTIAHGFIHKKQINELLTQNDKATDPKLKCAGLRIYWGIDTYENVEKYIIRMVLFGVDGYGRNIIVDTEGKSHLLEQSWPPF